MTRGTIICLIGSMGLMVGQALGVTDLPDNSPLSGSITDRSALYRTPTAGGPMVTVPDSSLGASQFGSEQRTVFNVDAIDFGIVDPPLGSKGLHSISDTGITIPGYGNGNLRGVLYNLNIGGQEVVSGVPGAGTAVGNLYFTPSGGTGGTQRTPTTWVDLVPSKSFSSIAGLNGAGLATLAGGFGGIVEIYFDPTPSVTGAVDPPGATPASVFDPDGIGLGAPGAAQWVDYGQGAAGAITGPRDIYPTLTTGGTNADMVLVLQAVFTPIYNVTGAPEAALAALGLAGPPVGFPTGAFIPPTDTVLLENIDEPGLRGSGVGFLNIIGGDAAFLSQFDLDAFGPGRDIRLDFDLDFSLAGTPGSPVVLTVDGWQVESDDPVQFQTSIIPEPFTATLSMLGLSTLGLYMLRRR